MSRNSTDSSRHFFSAQWNRALSIRSSNRSANRSSNGATASAAPSHSIGGGGSGGGGHRRHGFSFTSLRGSTQPALSKRLYKLIKSGNQLVSAHEAAARERLSIATQLSEWGEQQQQQDASGAGADSDGAISDVSDRIGVVLSELGEQEEAYAARLDESRGVLKAIRDTERSVQPARDGRRRIADEIARLKAKEPQSARLVTLEQELVRAEAEGLVAEAQLGNVTRQKLREAYTIEFLATIERAEKQAILARHGLRLLQLLDDTPAVPGDVRPPFPHAAQARQILNDAEDDLREWRLDTGLVSGGGGVGDDDDKGAAVAVDGSGVEPLPVAAPAVEKGKEVQQPQPTLENQEGLGQEIPAADGEGVSGRF